ncbi:hypothetical protein EDD27_5385 [Nonomuraea polychroma]|uniref:Uncharacterized protein n=1 Tax=Nonomuraea polychroma TaxID=46176 RepID=A0A438MAH8_9ACTN|nr:hypothetical protein EDD27_5385 [Nonomuraea polychroma]
MKRAASDMAETAFAVILGDYPESRRGGSSGRGAGGHVVLRSRILAAFLWLLSRVDDYYGKPAIGARATYLFSVCSQARPTLVSGVSTRKRGRDSG